MLFRSDIPSNLDNIVILIADDIRVDKIIMREAVRGCLDRLMSQNYIGRTGDTYNFLTDEEQDIQREIRDTNVDTASIVERIAQMIYGDIFTTKKFRYGKYDFAFDQMVAYLSENPKTMDPMTEQAYQFYEALHRGRTAKEEA